MASQAYSWTCSVCTTTWIVNSTGMSQDSRSTVGSVIGYPECVNETYGLMSSQCMIDALAKYGLKAKEVWVTFDEAFSIIRGHTGGISPQGMYHWMAIRGVDEYGGSIWVANSAPGYLGVWDVIDRETFNRYGPVKLVYVESYL